MTIDRLAQVCLALVTGAGLLASLPSDAAAAPAGVRSNTNMRQGPGTTYSVTATVPGGSVVEVSGCNGQWCTAHWRGLTGYMIANNLDLGGSGAGGPGGPGPVVVAPPPVGYYGEPYYESYYEPYPYRYWDRRRYRDRYHYRSYRRW
jgi:uncharacterized protein YraI